VGFGRDDWEPSPVKYTYEELSKEVDDEWESLGEEGQYMWYINPSPTFNMWVLGLIKPGQSVEIDESNHQYKIIE